MLLLAYHGRSSRHFNNMIVLTLEPHMVTYTPYDGSSTPFTIGLTQLDLNDWIEPDADLARYVAEKRRLLDIHRDVIFRSEPDTLDAQQEVLALLADYLPERYPNLYRRKTAPSKCAGAAPCRSGQATCRR